MLKDILLDEGEKLANLLRVTEFIRTSGFTYEAIDTKLSKSNKSRKFRANVIYRINSEGQNAYLNIISKDGVCQLNLHILKNQVYDFFNQLYKSKWEGDTFILINRNGLIYKSFEIKNV